MAISTRSLLTYLDELLNVSQINDFCPNGLQVEGKSEIEKVVTGVTASQKLIDTAIAHGADAILVHHGYFWKGEAAPITGMKQKRVKALLTHDINLIAYHLPLDVHETLGNNKQLADILGIGNVTSSVNNSPSGIVMQGEFSEPLTHDGLIQRITERLGRTPLSEAVIDRPIKNVAWCTGGGQGYIESAFEAGCDAFITGEVSEQTIHSARELGIDFFAAGHHATERYGAKALGEHIQREFGLDVTFVDIPNPA